MFNKNSAKSGTISKYRRFAGGIVLTIGYILSPASWWNDALINIPLAYMVAWLFSLISLKLFLPVMFAAYWATNVIGLLMMQIGGTLLLRKDVTPNAFRLRRMIIISTVYTFLMVLLVKFGILRSPF
jgi:hypothetical protein